MEVTLRGRRPHAVAGGAAVMFVLMAPRTKHGRVISPTICPRRRPEGPSAAATLAMEGSPGSHTNCHASIFNTQAGCFLTGGETLTTSRPKLASWQLSVNREMLWCQLFRHWKSRDVILPTFLLREVQQACPIFDRSWHHDNSRFQRLKPLETESCHGANFAITDRWHRWLSLCLQTK